MTLNDNVARSDDRPPERSGFSRLKIFSALFFLLGLFGSFLLTWLFLPVLPPSPLGEARAREAMAPFDERLATLEHEVADGNRQHTGGGDDAPPQSSQTMPAAQTVQAPAPSALEIAHMQSDLVALSSAFSGLQGEVRRQHSDEAATQEASRNFLAMAVGFIEVRAASSTGHGFKPELESLRVAAGNREGFQSALQELEGVAVRGAPTVDQLRQQFAGLEGRASVAIDKATAATWWKRLRAEFEELIAIRPLHGSAEGDVFEPVEVALAEGNLSDASHALEMLPPSARNVLKEFEDGLHARLSVDDALHSLAEQLITPASSGSPPAAAPLSSPDEGAPAARGNKSRPGAAP